MNKLGTRRPHPLPAGGSTLWWGVLTSVGVGAGVQSRTAHFSPASSSAGLSKTLSFCLGFSRCCRRALYSDTTAQGKNRVGGINRME